MDTGKILVAKSNGVYVLKLTGDVRLTLCAALDIFLEKMVDDEVLRAVFIDLSEAQGIDSTTLGFLAKISILTQKTRGWKPTIISTNADITRLLYSMSFDQVFNVVEEPLSETFPLDELQAPATSEDEVRDKVLEAHRILMGLSDDNRARFQELVKMLENT